MLETLVTWVLNNYIGEYFDLNTDQLSIAILQGQVDLENITLRKSSLRKFDIPIEARHGLIGKLQLQIPLAYIRSQPWILKVRDFFVLLGPCTSSVYDVQIMEQFHQEKWEKMLDEIEIMHKRKLIALIGVEQKEMDQQQDNSWWGASLLSTVSDNIQIVLENVHIRYECPEFNFGVQIQSLFVQTTNRQWQPGFVQPKDGENIFKRFDINGLSIYWNSRSPVERKASSVSEQTAEKQLFTVQSFKKEFEKNFSHASQCSPSSSFILPPFSTEVRIEKDCSKFPLRTAPYKPRFKVDICSSKMELELTKQQIAQFQKFIQHWSLFERARPHRKWRPIVTVKQSAKKWWEFAIGRTIDEIHNRNSQLSKSALLNRLKLSNAYCRAYRNRLKAFMEAQTQSKKSISKKAANLREGTALLKQIEHDSQFTYDQLHTLREAVFQNLMQECMRNDETERTGNNDSPFEVLLAESSDQRNDTKIIHKNGGQQKLRQQSTANTAGTSGWYQWITNIFGEDTNSAAETNSSGENPNEVIYLNNMRRPNLIKHDLGSELEEVEKRMEKEILQVLNESWDDSNILRRDNLLAELFLSISRVLIRIVDEDRPGQTSTAVTFDLTKLNGRVQLSPKEHRTELSLSVRDLSVQQLQFFPSKHSSFSDSESPNLTIAEREAANGDGDDSIGQFEFDSIMCGFQNDNLLNTRILLTIGRAYDGDEPGPEQRNRSSTCGTIKTGPLGVAGSSCSSSSTPDSILRLFYKRLAPKQEAYHQLDVQCVPLSLICDENVLSELLQMFRMVENEQLNGVDADESASLGEKSGRESCSPLQHSIFAYFSIPQLFVELRSEKAANNYLFNPNLNCPPTRNSSTTEGGNARASGDSSNFARANLSELSIAFSQRDDCRLKMQRKINLNFDSFVLEDLFEREHCNEEWPLVSIGNARQSLQKDKIFDNNLSRSCPDLSLSRPQSTTAESVFSKFSRILRNAKSLETVNGMLDSNSPSSAANTGIGAVKSSSSSPYFPHSVSIVFANFDGLLVPQKRKMDCKIIAKCLNSEIKIGVNRRTWILLFDFLGLLNGQSGEPESTPDSYCLGFELEAKGLAIGMNYPRNGTQLGICTFAQPKLTMQIDLGVLSEPILAELSAQNFLLQDISPLFSRFYKQRMNVDSEPNENGNTPSPVRINFLKHRTAGEQFLYSREFDISVGVEVCAPVNYVHTHRFFFALLDFWFQFMELYEKTIMYNAQRTGQSLISPGTNSPFELLKTRCRVSLLLSSGVKCFFPLSQFSPEAFVLESAKMQAFNHFCFSSEMSNRIGKFFSTDKSAHSSSAAKTVRPTATATDCLLDWMNISFRGLTLRHGTFVAAKAARSRPMDGMENRGRGTGVGQPHNSLLADNNDNKGEGQASNQQFNSADSQVVLDKSPADYSLTLEFCRNLSSFYCKDVPDLFVLLPLRDLELNCTSDFYKLFRGFLDNNIGEQIIPQPDTIPLELLELPEINLEPYNATHSTFAFRVSMKKIQIKLSTPISLIDPNAFEEFAKLNVVRGKLSFTSRLDSQSEFDFICDNGFLEDMAEDIESKSKQIHSAYKKIVRASTIVYSSTEQQQYKPQNLNGSSGAERHQPSMHFEAHILMRKEQSPTFSIILVRARIILLMDWIEKFKSFILLNTAFSPAAEYEHFQGLALRRRLHMAKSGVLLRAIPPFCSQLHSRVGRLSSIPIPSVSLEDSAIAEKFTIKVTLKECELVALESSQREDSFALVAPVTAVVICNNLTDCELVESQYEIQQFSLFTCLMNAELETRTQLSNDTSATITISYDNCFRPNSNDQQSQIKKQQPNNNITGGNSSIEFLLFKRRQIIHVDLGPIVIRARLMDLVNARIIFAELYKCWELSQQDDFLFWTNSSQLDTAKSTTQTLFPSGFSYSSPNKFASSLLNSCKKLTWKLIVNAVNLCIWIMEDKRKTDGGQSLVPFLRIYFNDLNLQRTLCKYKIRFNCNADYYRQRSQFGWEPLLESWEIESLDASFVEPNQWNLRMRPAKRSVMEVNLTEIFLEEAFKFISENQSILGLFFQPSFSAGNMEIVEKYRELCKNVGEDLKSRHSSSKTDKGNIGQSTVTAPDGSSIWSSIHSTKFAGMTSASQVGVDMDIELDLDAGLGISVIGMTANHNEPGQKEELIYARLTGIRLNVEKRGDTYRLNCSIYLIQADNQLQGVDRWHFLFCGPSALNDEPASQLPAIIFELSYTPSEFFDVYECLRLKMCNCCILLDEQLLWHLVQFGQNVFASFAAIAGNDSQAEAVEKTTARNCYYGTLLLEFGNISLSVTTVDKSILPPGLRHLKECFAESISLVSFENAPVTFSPFWVRKCLIPSGNIWKSIGHFYLEEFKNQKLNIMIAMDAFGNPMGLANEVKEGLQGLFLEGDLAGLTLGLGYGAANSISKFASSMAQGVGSLTFDDQHELLRRKMLRTKPEQSNALTHLYGGIKGLGVGIFGGVTAIAKNTYATQQEGMNLKGLFRGMATGAVDTLTKPLQGTLDLLEGTASAIKEMAGATLVRRAHFPDNRLRLPRVCSSLNGLIAPFCAKLAESQRELLRITGAYSLNEENRLLCVVTFLDRLNVEGAHIVHRALITLVQCYVTRQVDDDQPGIVTHRILFQHLKSVQCANREQQQHKATISSSSYKQHSSKSSALPIPVEVFLYPDPRTKRTAGLRQSQQPSLPSLTLWCSDRENAQCLCKQIMKAKTLFDRLGIRTREKAGSKRKTHTILNV